MRTQNKAYPELGKAARDYCDAVTIMTTRQRLLLEIETAKMRHAWAKAEVKRGEPSPALIRHLGESLQELRTLKALVVSTKAARR